MLFFCVIVVILVLFLICYNHIGTKEDFLSGTDIQLLTSKPYTTLYDYASRIRYPYEYGVNPYYQFYGRPLVATYTTPFWSPYFYPGYRYY